MADSLQRALDYAHNHQVQFLNELMSFLSIPSISTDPSRKPEMLQAAQWCTSQLQGLGFTNVEILPTSGHPVVYAEYLQAGTRAPTILIYGHYDVQPAEPLELWQSDPFTPEQRGQNLYARGASDMKGQVIATLKAVESILKTSSLPVNIKYLLEGEEEIGSPSLGEFLQNNKSRFAADLALNPDAGMVAQDIPTIVYTLRGLAYFELRVYGPGHDLHSGVFGGVVHNPAIALAELIAGMHDSHGRITLPGFYDSVRPLDPEERTELARLPMTEEYYKGQTGASVLYGEAGFTPAERIGARPTLDVNGLYSGFIGEGSKTVIPSWAMAKISMRLVPDQNPDQVHQQLLAYLEQKAPATIRWELLKMAGGPACSTNRHQPGVEALRKALQSAWGVEPVFKREGGSVPVVGQMQEILKVDSVLTGFGLPDDNLHAPNEKLHLPTWFKGIDSLIYFLFNMLEVK